MLAYWPNYFAAAACVIRLDWLLLWEGMSKQLSLRRNSVMLGWGLFKERASVRSKMRGQGIAAPFGKLWNWHHTP